MIRTSYLPENVWMQKQKELTFYNISRHVVKSSCGSSFSATALFYNYPILLLLKQICDISIVDGIQMISTEVLHWLEPHFEAYTSIRNTTMYRKLPLFGYVLELHSHNYPTHSVINIDANSSVVSI